MIVQRIIELNYHLLFNVKLISASETTLILSTKWWAKSLLKERDTNVIQ